MAAIPREKVVVAGTAFDNVALSEVVTYIRESARKKGAPQHICTGNLDHLALLQNDEEFRAAYEEASLVLADGMPIVWLSRLQKSAPNLQERVAGSDLFCRLGAESAQSGLRLFLLGGMPGAAEKAVERLREQFPRMNICGTYCPPQETFHTPEEQERILGKIRAAAPDVLLVGLGAPKQEKWILANKNKLQVPVSIGVGGSFEMAAGMVRRAPLWVQNVGMEWLFRLAQDPRRLWERYIGRDLPFLLRLVYHTLLSNTAPKQAGSFSEVPSTKRATPSA